MSFPKLRCFAQLLEALAPRIRGSSRASRSARRCGGRRLLSTSDWSVSRSASRDRPRPPRACSRRAKTASRAKSGCSSARAGRTTTRSSPAASAGGRRRRGRPGAGRAAARAARGSARATGRASRAAASSTASGRLSSRRQSSRDRVSRLEPRARAEELDRLRLGERRHRVLELAPDAQQLAAGDEQRAGSGRRSSSAASSGAASTTCSRLSSSSSISRSPMCSASASCAPSVCAIVSTTSAGSRSAASPTQKTPALNSRTSSAAASIASRVLPEPPGPGQRDETRAVAKRGDAPRRRSRSRPTNDDAGRGRFVFEIVFSGGNAPSPSWNSETGSSKSFNAVLAESRQRRPRPAPRVALRDHDLPAVPGAHHPRRQMNVHADVLRRIDTRLPRVHAHPDPDRPARQGLLIASRDRCHRLPRRRRRRRRRRHPRSRPRSRRRANASRTSLRCSRQCLAVPSCPSSSEQTRGALDVGEHQRHRAVGLLAHPPKSSLLKPPMSRARSVVDSGGDGVPVLRCRASGGSQVLPRVRVAGSDAAGGAEARGAQVRHYPLLRPRRVHRHVRDVRSGRRAAPLRSVHPRVQAEIERFGGSVEKYIGESAARTLFLTSELPFGSRPGGSLEIPRRNTSWGTSRRSHPRYSPGGQSRRSSLARSHLRHASAGVVRRLLSCAEDAGGGSSHSATRLAPTEAQLPHLGVSGDSPM